jgi:ABC-type sugar transport system ATPase subunit
MSLIAAGLRLARPNGFKLEVPELRLGDGRITALLGPNGAGKSTLLRCLSRLEKLAAGSVRLDGANLRREQLAMCFQERVFLDGTVRWNLGLALELRGVPRRERPARIEEVTAQLGLGPILDRDALRLSAGEQQRANLARVLALRPPVLLLDEALASFDLETRERLIVELPAAVRRHSRVVVTVSHDRRESLGMADDVVVLREGRVLASGSKAALFAAPPDAPTARALGLLVLDDGARLYAVDENELRLGEDGGKSFALAVERVLDVGGHVEITGRCGGARVMVRASRGAALPAAGDTTRVSVARAAELPPTPRSPAAP